MTAHEYEIHNIQTLDGSSFSKCYVVTNISCIVFNIDNILSEYCYFHFVLSVPADNEGAD